MTCLLLRPVAKYQKSAEAFRRAGVDAVGMALIDTEANTSLLQTLQERLQALPAGSLVVFVSTTAASLVTRHIRQWPSHVQAVAVGPSTAAILTSANIHTLVPDVATSEGLLAMPAFAQVADQQVVLVKGVGGRPLLAETLRQRQAEITEWPVYRRFRLNEPLVTGVWHPHQIRCIIATSGELIEAAFQSLDKQWLTRTPWVLVSQRTADIAAKLGVNQIHISQDATDTALIRRIQQLPE